MGKPDIEKVSLRMENIWKMAEQRIIQDVIRRIQKSGKITSTADYQINRLIEMGRSTQEVETILKETLNLSYPELYKLYDEVANWEYVRSRNLYEQVNGNFIPPEENEWLQQVSAAVKEQTKDQLVNLSGSYGFSMMLGNRRAFMPFSEYYQRYVDAAIMDVVSGAFDYNTVIRRTVTQMTNSGLRVVDYATGRSNRVDVAVRRAVLTGVNQIAGRINEQNAKLLGTNYFEVTWHEGARPTHRIWQGRVYSKEELETVCGLYTVTGLCGANCRHNYYAFIPGVSSRAYTDEWLEEQNRKEAETKTWNGKEYDAYERTQKQRQMETAMRAQREKVSVLKSSGVDQREVMLAKAKYQAQLDEYKRYCKKMGLREQRERIYYDMRGRVAPGRTQYLAAEKSLRTKSGGNYGVNWKVVKSKEYTQRFDLLSDNKSANLLAAQRARNALVNRNGKKTEELYAIGLVNGKDVSSILNQHHEFGVARTKKFIEDVKRAEEKGERILFIHNHPNGTPPSIADINELLNHKNASGITVGHTGSLYYYSKPKEKINESDYRIALRKMMNYNGDAKIEKALEYLAEKFEFEFNIL